LGEVLPMGIFGDDEVGELLAFYGLRRDSDGSFFSCRYVCRYIFYLP
jgi:hypothetical protein